MTFEIRRFAIAILLLTVTFGGQHSVWADEALLQLRRGDHVAIIGNTLADRMQHHGWLETYLQALYPEHDLTFRNLGFSADEIRTRPRSDNFGTPDEWLTKAQADVVLCFFGYNEALRGSDGLAAFEKELGALIDEMSQQQYNGESSPRIVFFSPVAHENLESPHLPDGVENNKKLQLYTRAMGEVCRSKNVAFVDLFTPTLRMYEEADRALTLNGIHLLEHGNEALATVILRALLGDGARVEKSAAELARLREAVLEKNYYWFSRYRVVDGYNVFGGRSKLAWHGQSNADVMEREMEIFDLMTANRDRRIWAVARGGDLEIDDSNVPPLLEVRTNKPGDLEGEEHPYLGGKDAIGKMKIAEGMEVNLFASEEMFPEMVNPVQLAVDTDSRLFASVWPSYPHWNPTLPRTDRIVCLPDDDRDGVADRCVIFADELNSITGFEFWGGGMLVAAPPEIWFLKDTDGDDRADVKVRMLQGVSSADTHHTANALVIGPGGWLYWSRGIFNTASMETPTRTYRSDKTGVHRFNPRTFEVEFHFPIGPNPHGDVFDQWGFQFANDGTSGTGSYVNIGKGQKYKKWFKKRVRPVAATGILSSSHFPEANQGNFLICNTIGFLGVLQHEVQYDGADIRAVEVEPILVSSDPNFRPTDIEVGGDGALYVSDWCNVLIGHMQHNMRDPNRDGQHGRIYRVTYKGRELLEPPKLKGKPNDEVCQAFFAKENSTRYRARLELSGRDTEEVTAAVAAWASKLTPLKAHEAQALLECLWVFEEHGLPSLGLLNTVFRAEEPRVRAAAIRTLGHWGPRIEDWEPTLIAAARDGAPLVRAEAVKAAVSFEAQAAAEVVFEVGTRPTDPELVHVLKYARKELGVDARVKELARSGGPMSAAARKYLLQHAEAEDLLELERTEAVYTAILSRPVTSPESLQEALSGLAAIRKVNPTLLLLDLIDAAVAEGSDTGLQGLGRLLAERPPVDLRRMAGRLEELAVGGATEEVRRLGFTAWIAADRTGDDAYLAASQGTGRLQAFLEAVPAVPDASLRSALYERVRPLIFDLPMDLRAEAESWKIVKQGIWVDYFYPGPADAAIETFARLQPTSGGVVASVNVNVPQRTHADRFGLRFTGTLQIEKAGSYRFYTESDDGSRLYIDGKLVVNNDGTHGMERKKGSVDLAAGAHVFVVTYFETDGIEGLNVQWRGPGFKTQEIPAEVLTVGGGEPLEEVAIRALSALPGHESEKFVDLASLVKTGRHRAAAIAALRGLPPEECPPGQLRPLVDNLVGYLSEMPASERTRPAAAAAIALAQALGDRLSSEEAQVLRARLENLDVRVIAIGTVPLRMVFDKERIVVEAGRPIEFRFSNSDEMPHNFAVTQPGALEEIGLLAEATARDADAVERQYIPKSEKILVASRLLQPGESQSISFDAPQEPGIYPYVCTYPGHWRRMYGALYVVEDLAGYRKDPTGYLASQNLELKDELLEYNTRSREWTFDELVDSVKPLPAGRSFDVGKQLFKISSCVGCHRLDNEGQVFGPDLAKLDEKKQSTEHLLRSMLEPSKEIDEKFQSQAFVLSSGKVVTGMVVEETSDEVHVVVDPIAKNKPTVIAKKQILNRDKLSSSIMPEGLLNRLTREEILDLVAYVHARGDKKHELFKMAHHH